MPSPAQARTAASVAAPVAPRADAAISLQPLAADAVQIDGGFWAERQRINRDVSLPLALVRLREAGNLSNLRMAAEGKSGAYHGPLFMDSDVYKVLEAVAWEEGRQTSPELLSAISTMSAAISDAQREDGYVNSYVQVTRGDADRYTDLAMGHELYCFGHLIQAAVAVQRVAPNAELWQATLRVADHVNATFGPGGSLFGAVEGHPVIEMALVELYRETGDITYRDLAEQLVKARGQQTLSRHDRAPMYFSDRVPARDATTVEGHAVRALYFAAGVADVVAEGADYPDSSLSRAQLRQWEHMVRTKTYLTGGLGSRWDGEAFGDPFELPADEAYCETCAAIGSIQWSWRLLLATGEARYADLMERTLYNGFIAGVSTSGDEFFYVNALQVRSDAEPSDSRSAALGRHAWYDVACCPPNIMRTLSSLQCYLATRDDAGVQIHQYSSGRIKADLAEGQVELAVDTEYPWSGTVQIEVTAATGAEWALALRIPAWCQSAEITVDTAGSTERVSTIPGPGEYSRLTRRWAVGDRVRLDLAMPPRLTAADERVDAVRGCVAIERGPLVYCLEQTDQAGGIALEDLTIADSSLVEEWRPDLLGGVMIVRADGVVDSRPPAPLYRDASSPPESAEPVVAETVNLTAVPYALWGNRELGAMRVWIPLRQEARAT
jgi:uncharacterized protein